MLFLLQHLLTESAAKYPDRIAVKQREGCMTYRELEQTSNKLANLLISLGVCRGDRIGIYMPKTINSIVSIIGILKAGGTYVPVAPDAPQKRVDYIIRNCGIERVICAGSCTEQLNQLFKQHCPLKTIIQADDALFENPLPVDLVGWRSVSGERPDLTFSGSIDRDLAYILYTSGSTGEPKGVMISHLNSLTFINWAQEFFQITEEDQVASYAPLHFDLSIFDIFAAIKAGATIVLVPDGAASFPIRLAGYIQDEEISVWNSVPSVLILLVTHGKLEKFSFPKLRLVLFAGEKFPVKYLRQLKSYLPGAHFYNQYGQTEANSSTYYKVDTLPDDRGQIPIGKAAANFEVFALNDENRLIKQPGETGELYINSSSVAQGYWADPEKTRRAFVDNPLGNCFADKVFKTGDLVSLDQDGNYVFISRKDNMIKSRGYRIEPGEIESAIAGHPAVKHVAVIPIPDEIAGNRIKAFVVPVNNGSLSGPELEKYCLDCLPRYMVPDSIEITFALPMTSTGKIDKRSLFELQTA